MRALLRLCKSWKVLLFLFGMGAMTLTLNYLTVSVPKNIGHNIWQDIQYVQRKSLAADLNLPSFFTQDSNQTFVKDDTEVQHVVFLKVHKAASSTAQNIFLRFGWRRKLTFVLPPAKNPSGYPNIISLKESLTDKNILPPPPNGHYDILCNHVLYTRDAFNTFMPRDAAYIGILREPFELYKSILNYFRPRYIFNKIDSANPASDFLRNPGKYEPKGSPWMSWTKSRMAVEYGFPRELFDKYDATKSNAYIRELDNAFKLVIISELMEESVVLMRRVLNWSTQDILYVDQNVAKRKNETMLSKPFDRDFYKKHAPLDYDLYDFFYKRLRKQIRAEGEDFDDELLAFRALRKGAKDFCWQASPGKPLIVAATKWGPEFSVTKDDCMNMIRGEIDFITRIRIRQYGSKDI